MKYLVLMLAAVSLSACSGSGSGTVSRAATGVGSCGQLGGMTAEYMNGANLRCGPQSQLPY